MPKVVIPTGVIFGILAFLALGSMVGEKKADKILGLVIGYGVSIFVLGGLAVVGFFVFIFIFALFLPPLKRGKKSKG